MQTCKIILAIVSVLILTVTVTQSASIKVSGGENHTLVLTENGFVWTCGPNGSPVEHYSGVLGTGSYSETLIEKTFTRVY